VEIHFYQWRIWILGLADRKHYQDT
jgi:hypothetical protein